MGATKRLTCVTEARIANNVLFQHVGVLLFVLVMLQYEQDHVDLSIYAQDCATRSVCVREKKSQDVPRLTAGKCRHEQEQHLIGARNLVDSPFARLHLGFGIVLHLAIFDGGIAVCWLTGQPSS